MTARPDPILAVLVHLWSSSDILVPGTPRDRRSIIDLPELNLDLKAYIVSERFAQWIKYNCEVLERSSSRDSFVRYV